jgi:outer membrane receptor protein involved in Fe transport
LTKVQKERVPSSVTVITSEDIRLAPARNIYDLINIFVPGAVDLTHHEGPHIALRGISADRNYKFILLLNSRRVNQDGHSGGVLELENWDMNDIQRIEIVRGPGSTTYGPGAIEGVINIITKNADTSPGWHASTQYVYPYDSKLVDASYGWAGEQIKVYGFGSVARTSGILPQEFSLDATGRTGYLGSGVFSAAHPEYYFNDAQDKPQMKYDLEMDWLQEWQAFAHYSNSGTSEHAFATQTLFPDGTYENIKENTDQGALFMVRNQHKFVPELELKSTVSYSSLDHARYQYSVSGGGSEEATSLKNVNQKFSESEALATVVGNYALAEKYQFALGGEYSEKWFGPGWGDSADRFRMGDSSNIFGSQAAANAAGATAPYYLTDGWKAFTASAFTEINLEFDPRLDLIMSGRLDRHEWFSTPFFSPRVSLVSDNGDVGVFKLIWQQSVRANTEEQMYLSQLTGVSTSLEKLNGWEFDYNVEPVKSFTVNTSFYYNTIDIVGWQTLQALNTGFSYGQSTVLGTLRVWGVEVEEKYAAGPLTVGANESYSKQIDFHLAAGQTGSGISYSDYNVAVSGEHLTSTGDDLNNWYNCAVKLFADYKIAAEHTVHLDTRIFWDYQGAQNGLDMMENAAQGTANQPAVDQAVQGIKAAGGFSPDVRLDLSYRYDFLKNMALTVFGMNLVNFTNNKIYEYDSGALKAVPAKVAWINEPLTVGAKVDFNY